MTKITLLKIEKPQRYDTIINKMTEHITVAQASEILHVKYSTVRSFLDRGLVPHVRRDAKKNRILEPWQVDLLQILISMKQAGFSSKELRRYSRLFRQGRQTQAERLAMLTTRKHQLWQEIEVRQKAINFIERQEELDKQPRSQARH